MSQRRQGKHVCAVCDEPITGQIVLAGDKKYHVDHFRCSDPKCNEQIEGPFVMHDGVPYHEDHVPGSTAYAFGPGSDDKGPKLCARCDKTLVNNATYALGRYWHRDCLKCRTCGEVITKTGFTEEKGRITCKDCKVKKIQKKMNDKVNAPSPWG